MLLAVSACKTEQRVNSRKPVTDPGEDPLPANTPFDDIADARAYFEGYREGYRSGTPALSLNPYAGVGVAQPRSRGWYDGAFAARLAEALRIE